MAILECFVFPPNSRHWRC